MKVSNTLKSRSRNLKSQNVSGSQRKTMVSPSRIYHSPPKNFSSLSTVEAVATVVWKRTFGKLFSCNITAWGRSQDCYCVDGGLRWKFNLCQLILMWNCDRGNILSRNIWLKLVAPENLVSSLGILLYRWQPRNWEMAQIASDLENNHTGRKLPTLAISLGFSIEIFFISLSS